MVSFVCDYCQETIKKPKLEQHTYKCRNAVFSCIDCSKTFQGTEYKLHTSCITEVEKHQKPHLAKNIKDKPTIVSEITKSLKSDESSKESKAFKTTKKDDSKDTASTTSLIHSILKKKNIMSLSMLKKKLQKKTIKKGIVKKDIVDELASIDDLLTITYDNGKLSLQLK